MEKNFAACRPLARVNLSVLQTLFRLYRAGFPLLCAGLGVIPTPCRFNPTCSHYAEDAILHHGWLRGSFLALRQLSRCHPFLENNPFQNTNPKNLRGYHG